MNDVTFEQYLGGDPLAVLRAAQEKLRQEEEEKRRIADEQKRHDAIQAYRQQAIQRAVESDPLGSAQDVLMQPRTNDPLSKLVDRASQEGPLDRVAKLTPQDIEQQMYERIWGAPAKSKIGKVGKGISEVLGMFSGLPKDFSKPAMEQFLKIQQQHRMAQANDMTAMSQAARINSTDQNSTMKLYTELAKSQGKLNLDAIKAVDGVIRTDAYAKSVETDAAYKKSLDENKKAELLLRAKEISRKISNSFEYAKYRSELMAAGPEGRYMAELLRDNLLDYMQMEAGKNAASRGSGTSSTTRETQIKQNIIGPNGQAQTVVQSGPPVTSTTSRGPNQVGVDFMNQRPAFGQPPPASQAAKNYMAGQTDAAPVPKVETPKSNVVRYSAPNNPVSSTVSPTAKQGYSPVSIIKVNPPGVKVYSAGGPANLGVMKEFDGRTKNVTQLSDAANTVIDAYVSGVADRVHGFVGQPVDAAERGKMMVKTFLGHATGNSPGNSPTQMDLNYLLDRFKDDPEAKKYLHSIQLLSSKMLSDYIQQISGAQSAAEEANRLSQVFFRISDPTETVLSRAAELLHLTGTAESILGAGLDAQDTTMSGPARARLRKEKLMRLEANAQRAKLTKMAGGDWKQFMPTAEDMDFNRFLAETEEASGVKFKGVLFQGYDKKPTAHQKLQQKLQPEDEADAAFRKRLEIYKKRKK